MRNIKHLMMLRVRSRGPWHDLAERVRVGLIIFVIVFVLFPTIH